MSIKIDGRTDKERIYKEDGSEVGVIPSLYLNKKEITASGGGGTSTETSVKISECKNYAASKYSDADKVIVSINDWKRVEPTSGYCEVNADGEYPVSQFNGYKGICVTKEKESPDPDPVPEVDDIAFSISTYAQIADTSRTFVTSYSGTVDFNNYNVKIYFPLQVSYTGESADSTIDKVNGTLTLYINSIATGDWKFASQTIECLQYNITFSGTLNLNPNTNTISCVLNATTKKHPAYEAVTVPAINVLLGVNSSSGVISQTPKTASTTLSLRQSEVDTTISTYENLVVNNDAFIQGNLNVDGYINDFKWYWDEIMLESPNSVIGHGLLARLSQCSIFVDNSSIAIPELQLSPGAVYIANAYTIQWTADGRLLINQNIDSFTGIIKILRYE